MSRLFIAGMALFAFFVGFVSGTNNSAILSAGLFAAITAVLSVLMLLQKLQGQGESLAATAFDGKLAGALGALLIWLTVGFALGWFGGIEARIEYPAFFGPDRKTVPAPPSDLPASLMETLGWLAISERLVGAGLTPSETDRLIARYRKSAAPPEVAEVGKKWIGASPPVNPSATDAEPKK